MNIFMRNLTGSQSSKVTKLTGEVTKAAKKKSSEDEEDDDL